MQVNICMLKNIQKIIYVDAHYSYKKDVGIPSGKIISYGKIIEKTKKYINLEVAWSEDPHKTEFGIVLPIGAVLGSKKKAKIFKDLYKKNDTVAVYWQDIFVYNEEYVGPKDTTPMLTEGILLEETDSYILIKNPETLNLRDVINHPVKKPSLYYIPKPMIEEIKLIKK